MPTTAAATFGMGGVQPYKDPEDAVETNVNLKASTTYAAGTLLGEIAASLGTYGPYSDIASDGLQVAKGILRYPCKTDGSGNITLGDGTAGNEWGFTRKTVPMYVRGIFQCADLTGLDAAAVADLGRLIEGDTTTGILAVA